MKAKLWGILFITASHLGNFSASATERWTPDWSAATAHTRPSDMEVEASAPADQYTTAQSSVVSFMPAPDKGNQVVLALKDASRAEENLGASVSKSGFSARKARLSFSFYTPSAHRNGSLLVRLLNAEGECLASFSLFSKEHERGQLLLNTFAPQSDRRYPGENNIYQERTWTPVSLDYDGPSRLWSLTLGERTFEGLAVDANVLDPTVAKFEIHTGFGRSSMTQLFIDQLAFETL